MRPRSEVRRAPAGRGAPGAPDRGGVRRLGEVRWRGDRPWARRLPELARGPRQWRGWAGGAEPLWCWRGVLAWWTAKCARGVSWLELLQSYRWAHQQEEVRLRGELRQLGQPNGGRPASPRGGERNRSELHRGISEVRRSVEAMRQREEDEIRDGMRRVGRRN